MKRISALLLALLLSVSLLLTGCNVITTDPTPSGDGEAPSPMEQSEQAPDTSTESESETGTVPGDAASALEVPPYSGNPYVTLNGGQPLFTKDEIVTSSYEFYSPLDSYGRCGVVRACIGKDIMPTEDRESISSVDPSGWINNKYDSDLVSGGYIYNRSHLIGFQLTGENANERNLITGTRYFNVEGMLPFENMVADYLKEEPNNHVMYRVTPIYDGNNLVARGVQMEAYSVEDEGDGICFNVYIYNVQPGIAIDYATGNNWLDTENPPVVTDKVTESVVTDQEGNTVTFVLNTNTKKFHKPTCSAAEDINVVNREDYAGTRDALIADGYEACGRCKP